jgi:NAD(P)-dependent dehydrogenase (short-subunit alcohol dehydrogenase family)
MSRVVVITGGGTGIGAACARLLTQEGDRVFIVGRRREP